MTIGTTGPQTVETQTVEERPPVLAVGPLAWIRGNLFNSWSNAVLTVLILFGLAKIIPGLLNWLVFNSTVSAPDAEACRAVSGACWTFIEDKWRLILFGLYPADQQWRPAAATAVMVGLLLVSTVRGIGGSRIAWMWTAGIVLVAALMWGGFAGLPYVENASWGGLPLTLILSIVGLSLAFPLAILLALGRRSDLPVIKTLSVCYIEFIRGVPLITILFMASVMFPLFLPQGITIDKLLRAQVGIILFAAAYQAEVIRGGLQALPKGQYEAADSLGLGYWQKIRMVVLPQALTIVIPPMVNTLIGAFKDTSLVVIIGLFDLLSTAKAALTDPAWRGFYRESYLFIAVIYWVFCFFMSRYSQRLEADLNRGRRR